MVAEVKPFTPIKVEPSKEQNTFTPTPKPVNVAKVNENKNTFTPPIVVQQPSNVAPVQVSRVTPVVYKDAVPQEVPVYSAFENLQGRLPLTRKPYDAEL